MKKLIFISTLVTFVFSTSCGNSQPTATSPGAVKTVEEVVVTVDAKSFKDLLASEPGTVLDVRTPEEWAEGTLKDAVKMNYQDDNFASQIESLDKNAPVFVYCRRGGRSASASEILKESGFKKVYNLDGGITSWQDNGFEVVK